MNTGPVINYGRGGGTQVPLQKGDTERRRGTKRYKLV